MQHLVFYGYWLTDSTQFTIQVRFQSPSGKLANMSIWAYLQLLLHFASDFRDGNFWGPFAGQHYLSCKAVL